MITAEILTSICVTIGYHDIINLGERSSLRSSHFCFIMPLDSPFHSARCLSVPAMVVLAASILEKRRNGRVLFSRQFQPMTKVRIESLLQAFPKLITEDQQHTFVETDQVRTARHAPRVSDPCLSLGLLPLVLVLTVRIHIDIVCL